MGVTVIRKDSTKTPRKSRGELQKENEELRARVEALEVADRALAVLLGEVSVDE